MARPSHAAAYSRLTDYYESLTDSFLAIRSRVLRAALKADFDGLAVTRLSGPETKLQALPNDASLLDLGCALGDNMLIMRSLGYEQVSGLDIAPEMVRQARLRTGLPVSLGDFEQHQRQYQLVFAQALIHLYPKRRFAELLTSLMSLSERRLYLSTTLHAKAHEGIERKGQVERYRARYTRPELIGALTTVFQKKAWSALCFELHDPLGKHWLNVIAEVI